MPFHIALNMAGAVSAGAYTGGVVDFLVEALDLWYAAKEQQRLLHGDDIQLWTIPAHDVTLDVMSGASAGGMCAAIGSIALQETFDHVHVTNPGPEIPRNRLYESWVEKIDILPLLGTDDLPGGKGPVKSLLDSSPIDAIAETALQPDPAKAVKRKWIADKMSIILTLTNLRGIPYSVDESNAGSFEERVAYHADRIEFSVAAAGTPATNMDTNTTYALNYSDSANPNWGLLSTAARATGAFPVMLAARAIPRKRADYEKRTWEIDNDVPDAGACQSSTSIQPAWGDDEVPPAFGNAYVDGGVTNNNPFECARQSLANAAGNGLHNPREADKANAAVISVAPFPGYDAFQKDYNADTAAELTNVLKTLIGVLVDQSRFQGENLILTKDPGVFSRFAIAPVDDSAGDNPALLCAALGAFGGFIDRKFRDHDYQLGRRNCQKFLKDHFILPETNTTIRDGVTKAPEVEDAFRQAYTKKQGDTYWFPIIPLMPGVAEPIPALNRVEYFTSEAVLQQVADAATNRLKSVLHAFANSPDHGHAGWSFLISTIFEFGGSSKVKALILEKLTSELEAQTA